MTERVSASKVSLEASMTSTQDFVSTIKNKDASIRKHQEDLENIARKPSLFNQNKQYITLNSLNTKNFLIIQKSDSEEKQGIIKNSYRQIIENFENLTELILQFQLILENDVATPYTLDRASDMYI